MMRNKVLVVLFMCIVGVRLQISPLYFTDCSLCQTTDTGCNVTEKSIPPDHQRVQTVVQCRNYKTNTNVLRNSAPNPQPGTAVLNEYYRKSGINLVSNDGQNHFDPNFGSLPLFPPTKNPEREYFDTHNFNTGESIFKGTSNQDGVMYEEPSPEMLKGTVYGTFHNDLWEQLLALSQSKPGGDNKPSNTQTENERERANEESRPIDQPINNGNTDGFSQPEALDQPFSRDSEREQPMMPNRPTNSQPDIVDQPFNSEREQPMIPDRPTNTQNVRLNRPSNTQSVGFNRPTNTQNVGFNRPTNTQNVGFQNGEGQTPFQNRLSSSQNDGFNRPGLNNQPSPSLNPVDDVFSNDPFFNIPNTGLSINQRPSNVFNNPFFNRPSNQFSSRPTFNQIRPQSSSGSNNPFDDPFFNTGVNTGSNTRFQSLSGSFNDPFFNSRSNLGSRDRRTYTPSNYNEGFRYGNQDPFFNYR